MTCSAWRSAYVVALHLVTWLTQGIGFTSDAAGYLDGIESLTTGRAVYFPPGYSPFLARFAAISPAAMGDAVAGAQHVLMIVTLLALSQLTRPVLGRTLAAWSLIIAGSAAPTLFLPQMILSENVALAAMTGALWLAARPSSLRTGVIDLLAGVCWESPVLRESCRWRGTPYASRTGRWAGRFTSVDSRSRRSSGCSATSRRKGCGLTAGDSCATRLPGPGGNTTPRQCSGRRPSRQRLSRGSSAVCRLCCPRSGGSGGASSPPDSRMVWPLLKWAPLLGLLLLAFIRERRIFVALLAVPALDLLVSAQLDLFSPRLSSAVLPFALVLVPTPLAALLRAIGRPPQY